MANLERAIPTGVKRLLADLKNFPDEFGIIFFGFFDIYTTQFATFPSFWFFSLLETSAMIALILHKSLTVEIDDHHSDRDWQIGSSDTLFWK